MRDILQAEFEGFLAGVYPEQPALDSPQYSQLQDAFFGGAVVALNNAGSTESLRQELAAFLAKRQAGLNKMGSQPWEP